MHKGFIDKNRRLFNLRQMQVENVLPEHFAQYYPKFIQLLSNYYEWQNQENSTELLNHLFSVRDINETDITLLSYIEDELLLGDAYFEGFGSTDVEKRAAANFSNILFRSKGTKFAIEWFFRSFYNVDAEVLYPKENVFMVGDTNSTIGPSSLRYLTDDKLYQTYALLVRVGIPISKWREVFKLFAHPAGMYLGGEILLTDVKNIVTAFPADDSTVSQRAIPTYSLSAAASSVNEGQSLQFTATGSNIPDNIDALYYYIQNVSTGESDFVHFFDSINPGYVSINDVLGTAQGTFTITAKLDSDETESTESFKVFIRDRNGYVQDSATISLVNVLTSYTLEIDSARSVGIGSTGQSGTSNIIYSFNEGDVMNFRIVGDSTNPPNQQLQYYVEPIGLKQVSESDFTVAPPLVGSPATINIVNDSARFSLQTVREIASIEPSPEYFRIILKSGVLVKDSSDSIAINHLAPSFSLALDSDTIYEGQSLLASVTTQNYDLGVEVQWELLGDILADPRVSQSEGTIITTDTVTNFAVPFFKTDSAGGDVTGTLRITIDGYGSPSPATFTLIDSAAVYTINASPAAAAEGDSATFTVTGTNIIDGTTAYLYVDYNETTVSDFVSTPPLTGSRQAITFTSNVGSPDVSLQFAANGDSNETFTLNLSSTVGGSADLATRNFTITSVPYTLTPDVTNINEGSTVVFTLSAPDLPDGTYWYRLTGTNINSNDFVDGATHQFTVSGGTGIFSVTTVEDMSTEGTETFVADVSETLYGTAIVSSPTITINDTSASFYTISVDDIREGEQLIVDVVPDPGEVERLYYEITGSAAAKFSSVRTSVVVGSTTNPFTVGFPGTASTNTTYDGPISGTVTVSRGDYATQGGSVIDTATFTLYDAIATGVTLTPSDTTPDEGDTVTFTISGGINVPPTLYYSILNDIVTVQLDGTTSVGSHYVPLANTTGLEVGMTTTTAGIEGTIDTISAGGVYMTETNSSVVSSGTIVDFAFEQVFNDFDTYPAGSTSTSSFDITIATDSDFTNDSYTFVVRDAQYDGNNLATASITIQDQTTGLVDINATTTYVSDIEFSENPFNTAVAGIKFLNDGTIEAVGNTSPGANVYISNGTWITGAFTAADYTVTAVKTTAPSSPAYATGSYGSALNLGTTRAWTLEVTNPNVVGKNLGAMEVDFTVTQIGNPSNTQTVTVNFFVESYKTLEGGGGGEIEA